VLLIHGLGYTRQGWGPLCERLALSYRVISFDNRGIGESDIPPGPYSVEQLAGDAVEVLDEADVERAHVLGASLGGFVAQVVAADYPDRVGRLVLACTSPGGPGCYPLPEPTLRLMAEAPALAPEVALLRFVENAVAEASPPELIDEIYAYRQLHPPDPQGWAAQAGAGAAWDAGDRLERIGAPTLVITGNADTVVDPRNADLLAERIPRAQLEVLEGAGHMLFWERSEEFAEIVERFLG
jgi:3-oxoadipate enol-lactonase